MNKYTLVTILGAGALSMAAAPLAAKDGGYSGHVPENPSMIAVATASVGSSAVVMIVADGMRGGEITLPPDRTDLAGGNLFRPIPVGQQPTAATAPRLSRFYHLDTLGPAETDPPGAGATVSGWPGSST